MSRRLVIDTDTASDDAVALVMALRNPAVTVDAITVVAGNVPLDLAVQNALYTRDLCGSAVPVYAGRDAPLMRALETAQFVHGNDGMGDIGLPLSGRTPNEGHAADVLIETVMGSPGEITLVTLGPLSNVATALLREPQIANAVGHCFIMGGAGAGPGNVSALAEFNFWADPEAARVVVRSGMPFTLVGWDMSVRHATFGPDDAARIRSLGPLGEFCIDIQAVVDDYARTQSHLIGFDLPDPIAMAVAIDPGIATVEAHHVDVMIGDGEGRGKDIIDWLDTRRRDNGSVATHVVREAFVTLLTEAVAG